jgi:polyhydroxybutyrate depolymerase
MKTLHRSTLAARIFLSFIALSPLATADQVLQVNAGRGIINVYFPDSYDSSEPLPLLVGLHGYSHYGQGFEDYVQLRQHVDSRKFIYLYPNGTTDPWGNRYWNATDNCCDFWNTDIDDSGYIQALVQQVRNNLSVDERRISTIGHSNGGYMGYRLACDAPETFASIISLAGAAWFDAGNCPADQPVHVLQIHGTNDDVVYYNGELSDSWSGTGYPGAEDSVRQWVAINHCDEDPDESLPNINLEYWINGAETTKKVWSGCNPGGSGELWTIWGGSHSPYLVPAFGSLVLDWLDAHPKPLMATKFCEAGPNSVSTFGAQIFSSGYPSFSSEGLELAAYALPTNQFGIFFGGPLAQDPPLSFGNGYRCVRPQGLQRLNPAVSTTLGEATRALDLTQAPLDTYQPGDTRYFQFWYRDPNDPNGVANFNLSDGIELTFWP